MGDAALLERCADVIGAEQAAALRRDWDLLRRDSDTDLGRRVEQVVGHYGAPHLRPVQIRSRPIEAACWSLHALVRYAAAAGKPA